jgi:hypothetical protein
MTIPEPPAGRIIPLMPGVSRSGDRRETLRAAVLQVVDHLVLESVPPSRRSELFDQAMDMLDEAGWGLDELYAAATEPTAREALLNALGLLSGANRGESTTIPITAGPALPTDYLCRVPRRKGIRWQPDGL